MAGRRSIGQQTESRQGIAPEDTPTIDRSNDRPARLLLTAPEVAEVLALGRTKVYELIATGELEVIRIGRAIRVPTAVVAEFVTRQRRPTTHNGPDQSVDSLGAQER